MRLMASDKPCESSHGKLLLMSISKNLHMLLKSRSWMDHPQYAIRVGRLNTQHLPS